MTDKNKTMQKMLKLTVDGERYPKSVCFDHSVTGNGPKEFKDDCALCGVTTVTSFLMYKIAELEAKLEVVQKPDGGEHT